MVVGVCQVAVVGDVAVITCPVVGAAAAYMLTELLPELSHRARAIMLLEFPVSVLFVKVSVVFCATRVSVVAIVGIVSVPVLLLIALITGFELKVFTPPNV